MIRQMYSCEDDLLFSLSQALIYEQEDWLQLERKL